MLGTTGNVLMTHSMHVVNPRLEPLFPSSSFFQNLASTTEELMEGSAIEKGRVNSEKLADGRFPTVQDSDPHVLIDDTAVLPHKIETASTERVHAIDNLRTFLIGLLVLQHAILETVSRITGDAEASFPRQYKALQMFVGVGTEVCLGLLFLISGYGSSVSLVKHSRSPQQFVMRKTIRSAVLIVLGCFGAGITTYIFGPWETTIEGQTSYYALKIGKESMLHGPTFYLLLLFVFDSIYAMSIAVNTRNPTSFITSDLHYNLSKYAIIFILEVWTLSVAGGIIRPPSFLSLLLDFIHPTPQTLMQCAIGYTAGVHLTAYAEYLLVEHPKRFAPMIVRLVTRLWASSAVLFSMHRRFPDLIIHFSGLQTAPRLSIPQENHLTTYDDLFVVVYSLWSTLTFVLLATPLIQLFLADHRLNRDWGVISRATTIQPFIHMMLVFAIAKLAGCIGNLILRCAVVGLGAIIWGWGMGSCGLLIWDVLDGH